MAVKSRVTFISGSIIKWDTFLKETTDLTGRSPTRGADASGLNLSDYARFIAALGEFRDGQVLNPIDTLQAAGNILCHVYLSFLISGSSALIFRVGELTELSMSMAKLADNKGRVALVSGNLRQWKDAVVELCKVTQTRVVGNTVSGFFSKLGLQYVFSDFNRKALPSGLFLLEYKVGSSNR